MIEFEDQFVNECEAFDMDKEKFQIAFSVSDYLDGEMKHDQDKVEWEVHVYEGDGDVDKLA